MDGKDLLEGFRYIDPTYIREAKSVSFPSGPRRGALRKALPAIVLLALGHWAWAQSCICDAFAGPDGRLSSRFAEAGGQTAKNTPRFSPRRIFIF